MYELMIVDDEQSVVDGIAGTLPWEEMQIDKVHKAYSGQKAIDILSGRTVDIVITDIRMPGITGIDLIKRIRQDWPRTRTILLSGYSEFDYAKEALLQCASDYLLKPVRDEDLRASVEGAIEQIRTEWAAISSYERAVGALRANLPLMRAHLLRELLEGREYTSHVLEEKLQLLELPYTMGDETAVLLIRLEDEFAQFDPRSLSLFEFAIGNMAEEMFGNDFRLWTAKDRNENLVMVVKAKGDRNQQHAQIAHIAAQFQKVVSLYLKGTISLVASAWGRFPAQLGDQYASAVASLRRRVGSERGFFLALREGEDDSGTVNTLKSLYEPPALIHLFEAGRWEAAEEKLGHIFEELQERFDGSLEHLVETFFAIAAVLSHIAHKNGRKLENLIGQEFEMF
ncbi:response regulator, partial [Paenibacillus sepulcri]|nr:response regulator [Paenibacillus sepulcri]